MNYDEIQGEETSLLDGKLEEWNSTSQNQNTSTHNSECVHIENNCVCTFLDTVLSSDNLNTQQMMTEFSYKVIIVILD